MGLRSRLSGTEVLVWWWMGWRRVLGSCIFSSVVDTWLNACDGGYGG